MPVVAVGLLRVAGASNVVLDLSDEVEQNCVLGGLAASCQIALAERMDSGVLQIRLLPRRSSSIFTTGMVPMVPAIGAFVEESGGAAVVVGRTVDPLSGHRPVQIPGIRAAAWWNAAVDLVMASLRQPELRLHRYCSLHVVYVSLHGLYVVLVVVILETKSFTNCPLDGLAGLP